MSTRRAKDWPYWMRRLAATGEPAALNDLHASLRKSVGRGGSEARQANVVLKLIESYQEHGQSSDARYRDVADAIGSDREKGHTLEAFRIHDRIASDPKNFSAKDVQAGIELARQLSDDGLSAYFAMLAAQLAHGKGEIGLAKRLVLDAVDRLLGLTQQDPVYGSSLAKASINGTSFSVMDGDFDAARKLFKIAILFGVGTALKVFSAALSSPAPTEKIGTVAAEQASDFLEAGNTVRALEWFRYAERLLTEAHDEKHLCDVLGDLAVAYRRAGNDRAAIETNRRAIELCRKHGDNLNLARWSGNLGGLLRQAGDDKGARIAFEEAHAAAQRTGRQDQIAIAESHLGIALAGMGRRAEALERFDRALENAANERVVASVSRRNRLVVHASEAQEAVLANQLNRASDAIAAGLALVDWDDKEDKEIAGDLLVHRAMVEEARADLVGTAKTLDKAAALFDELGKRKRARELRAVRSRLRV